LLLLCDWKRELIAQSDNERRFFVSSWREKEKNSWISRKICRENKIHTRTKVWVVSLNFIAGKEDERETSLYSSQL
jgi:hypothetical protein